MKQRLDELELLCSSTEKSPVLINPDQDISKFLSSPDFPDRDQVHLTQPSSDDNHQILIPRKLLRTILVHLIKIVRPSNGSPQLKVNLITAMSAGRWFMVVSENEGDPSFPLTQGPSASADQTSIDLVTHLTEAYGGTLTREATDAETKVTVSFPQAQPSAT